jgi:Uma2 family endonuclease
VVMEIVSEGSVKKDTERLWHTYFQAGISEYWLIDARGEEMHFTIYIPGKKEYIPAVQQRGWQCSVENVLNPRQILAHLTSHEQPQQIRAVRRPNGLGGRHQRLASLCA